MKILGISAYYHDAAAALITDGNVVAAAQEERFSRIKHDERFPVSAIEYCLTEAGLTINELDAVVFYDKPFLKFERILQTTLEKAPKGLLLFVKSMPVWVKEKLFLKNKIRKELEKIQKDKLKVPLLFSNHHLSHAASAYFASAFNEAAILTIDGVGEWATASIAEASGNRIKLKKEMQFPHSLGLLYASFTSFLGFKVNEGEYKVMGLAPYADPESANVSENLQKIKNTLATLNEDGSLVLNPFYFSYTHSSKMIPVYRWEALFGIPARKPESPLSHTHAELAQALQLFTEECILNMAKYARKIIQSDNICLAGGVALNCVANGKLARAEIFKNIYVQPAAGDAGAALGAALAAYHIHFKKERFLTNDYMQGAALGPAFSDKEIIHALKKFKLSALHLSENDLLIKCCELLAKGMVMGWFQGRMEFGPRALGQRSILADARFPDMQRKLNLKIKKRESFRPFAPIMLEEYLNTYFENARPNAYMLFVYHFKKEWQTKRPENFYSLSFSEMLKHEGSPIPAITHIDYSARVQCINEQSGNKIYKLLKRFNEQNGIGILINTSFNIKDEPIVCSPEDAIKCFLGTEMDVLVLGNFLVMKNEI